MTRANTHAPEPTRRSTVRGRNKGKSLKRGCCTVAAYVAFDSCCGSSKTAAERGENRKNDVLAGCTGLVASSWSESDPRGYLPDFATLSAQSTRHGSRPGPTLATWCTGRSPACPAAESARNDPRSEEKSFVFLEQVNSILRKIDSSNLYQVCTNASTSNTNNSHISRTCLLYTSPSPRD